MSQSLEEYFVENFEQFITATEYALRIGAYIDGARDGSWIVDKGFSGARFGAKYLFYETFYFSDLEDFLHKMEDISDPDKQDEIDQLNGQLRILIGIHALGYVSMNDAKNSELLKVTAYNVYDQLKRIEVRLLSRILNLDRDQTGTT